MMLQALLTDGCSTRSEMASNDDRGLPELGPRLALCRGMLGRNPLRIVLWHSIVALALVGGTTGCGGPDPQRDLRGLWQGSWRSTSHPDAGTLTLEVEQADEESFKGRAWIQGSSVLDHGTLTGTIDWPRVRGEIRGGMAGNAVSFSLGNVTIAFSAVARSDKMVGDFQGRLLVADRKGLFEVHRPPPEPREVASATGRR